ncbi:proline-rich protein 19 [Anomalospiza imberbis]|uniref:proline-rich protein 19 n=1 Tax=Anomalospiza imberbis TaxID=187417 RepID=UPI00358F8DBD
MSLHRQLLGPRDGCPLPVPTKLQTKPKSKRLRTKRERNAAKFGPKVPLGGSRRGPAAPPRWLQPPPWGGLALGSPLGPPKPVVITQNRLCHRGLFNHEVKSLDVRRLLTPGPGRDGDPPPAPQIEEGEAGGVPAEALKDLVASLASLLGGFRAFLGRELVSERRQSLVAALRRHRRGPPDLGLFLAHRTPAQPPGTAPPGQGTPRAPRKEARPGPPGRAVSFGGWEAGDPPAGTPSPLRVVDRLPLPPRAPSPIFGALRERENPFSWSSAEDEEDETPGGLPQTWGGPGGLLPPPPPLLEVPTAPPGGGGGGGG